MPLEVLLNVAPAPQHKKLLAAFRSWVLPSVLLSAMSGTAGALGLGDIELRSGLGQAFHGTIPLLGEDASNVACARIVNANTSDIPMLAGARLNNLYEERTPRLEITTFRKVEEPVVRFDIIAGCGSPIRRSYTVFLDPPLATYPDRAQLRAASPEPAAVRPFGTPSLAETSPPARVPRPAVTARRVNTVAAASPTPGSSSAPGAPATSRTPPRSAPGQAVPVASAPAGVVPVGPSAGAPAAPVASKATAARPGAPVSAAAAPATLPGAAPTTPSAPSTPSVPPTLPAADSAQAGSPEVTALTEVEAQQKRAEELQAEASKLSQQNAVLLAQVRQVNEGLAEQAKRDQAQSMWIWLGSAVGLIVLLALLAFFFWFKRRPAGGAVGAAGAGGARGDPWWQSTPPSVTAGAAGAAVAGAAGATALSEADDETAELHVDQSLQSMQSSGVGQLQGSAVVVPEEGVTVEETDLDDALRHFSPSALNRSTGGAGASMYSATNPNTPVFEAPPTIPIAAYEPEPGTHLARLKDAESRGRAGQPDPSDLGVGHLEFDLELPEMSSPANEDIVSTERPDAIDFDIELPPAAEDDSDPFKKPRT